MFTFAVRQVNEYMEIYQNPISCIQWHNVYIDTGCLIDNIPFRDSNSMISASSFTIQVGADAGEMMQGIGIAMKAWLNRCQR